MSKPVDQSRIRRVAGWLSIATLGLAALLLAADIYIWADQSALWDALRRASLHSVEPPTAAQKLIGFAITLPLLLLMLWGLWQAYRLFRRYRAGEIISVEIGRRVRKVGIALALIPFVSALAGMANSVVLTWNNPDGQRQLALSIESNTLVMAIAGAMLIMIGWSLAEAARIADENRQFV